MEEYLKNLVKSCGDAWTYTDKKRPNFKKYCKISYDFLWFYEGTPAILKSEDKKDD